MTHFGASSYKSTPLFRIVLTKKASMVTKIASLCENVCVCVVGGGGGGGGGGLAKCLGAPIDLEAIK